MNDQRDNLIRNGVHRQEWDDFSPTFDEKNLLRVLKEEFNERSNRDDVVFLWNEVQSLFEIEDEIWLIGELIQVQHLVGRDNTRGR